MKKYRTCENSKSGQMRNKMKPKEITRLFKGWKPTDQAKGERKCRVT